MKTAAILASFLSCASAFAPTQQKAQSSSALAASFDKELGVQPPLGFWDPLNFLDGADVEEFNRLRFAEIKHGRVAMMAIVGHMVTTAGYRFPGCESFPSGAKALTAIPATELGFTIALVGALDVLVMQDKTGKGEYPGDLRNGLFKWDAPPAEQMQKRAIELNNGRAAQMGILGLVVHEQLTGEPYVLNAFLGYPTV